MQNPFIRVGVRMKKWIYKIIARDFGKVSYAKGLYNILYLYERWVPDEEKEKLRNGKRLVKRRWI